MKRYIKPWMLAVGAVAVPALAWAGTAAISSGWCPFC